jgi:hypothetical protein
VPAPTGSTEEVVSATITSGGSYSACPTGITFSGGDGSGAAGTPVCTSVGGSYYVSGINITAGGSYINVPTIAFTGGTGGGAAAIAVLSPVPGVTPIVSGGTGANTASTALSNLNAVSSILTAQQSLQGPLTAPELSGIYFVDGIVYNTINAAVTACLAGPYSGCTIDARGGFGSHAFTGFDPGAKRIKLLLGPFADYTMNGSSITLRQGLWVIGAGPATSGFTTKVTVSGVDCFDVAQGTGTGYDNQNITNGGIDNMGWVGDDTTVGQSCFNADVSKLLGTQVGYWLIRNSSFNFFLGKTIALIGGPTYNSSVQYVTLDKVIDWRPQNGDFAYYLAGSAGNNAIRDSQFDTQYNNWCNTTDATQAPNQGIDFYVGANGSPQNITLTGVSVLSSTSTTTTLQATYTSSVPIASGASYYISRATSSDLLPVNLIWQTGTAVVQSGSLTTTYTGTMNLVVPFTGPSGSYSDTLNLYTISSWNANTISLGTPTIDGSGNVSIPFTSVVPLVNGNRIGIIGYSDTVGEELNGLTVNIGGVGTTRVRSGTLTFRASVAAGTGTSSGTAWLNATTNPYNLTITGGTMQGGGGIGQFNGANAINMFGLHHEGCNLTTGGDRITQGWLLTSGGSQNYGIEDDGEYWAGYLGTANSWLYNLQSSGTKAAMNVVGGTWGIANQATQLYLGAAFNRQQGVNFVNDFAQSSYDITENLVPAPIGSSGVVGSTLTLPGTVSASVSSAFNGTITTLAGGQETGQPYILNFSAAGAELVAQANTYNMSGGVGYSVASNLLTITNLANNAPVGGATGTVTPSGTFVTGITVTAGGTYPPGQPPQILFIGGTCTVNPSATAVLSGTAVASATIGTQGNCSVIPSAIFVTGWQFTTSGYTGGAGCSGLNTTTPMYLLSANSTQMVLYTTTVTGTSITGCTGGTVSLVSNIVLDGGKSQGFPTAGSNYMVWLSDVGGTLTYYVNSMGKNVNSAFIGSASSIPGMTSCSSDNQLTSSCLMAVTTDTNGPGSSLEVCSQYRVWNGTPSSFNYTEYCTGRSSGATWLGVYSAPATAGTPSYTLQYSCTGAVCTFPSLAVGSSGAVTGIQGTDSTLLSAGPVAGGAGNPLCTDSVGGATTSGCPGFVPTFTQAPGDLACAVANDSTIDAVSVTGGSSTSSTITYTVSSLPNLYQIIGEPINILSTLGTNSTLGTPFTVTSSTSTSITITNSSNPGTFGSGGTLSLACANTTNDAISGTPYTFANSYTTPANMVAAGSYQRFVSNVGVFSPSSSPASIANTGLRLVYGAKTIYENESTIALSSNGVGIGGVLSWSLTGLTTTQGFGNLSSTTAYSSAANGSWSNIIITPSVGLTTAASTITDSIYFTATGVASAAYASGGTLSGTGNVSLATFNDSCSGTTATMAVSGGTAGAITITARGGACTTAPTTATCTSGTATCTGTVTLTSVLGGSPGNAVMQYSFGRVQ